MVAGDFAVRDRMAKRPARIKIRARFQPSKRKEIAKNGPAKKGLFFFEKWLVARADWVWYNIIIEKNFKGRRI